MDRAVKSGVLVAGITAALGFFNGNLDLMTAAMDGALMAGSVFVADLAHFSSMLPNSVSPSLVAGTTYTAVQYLKGDHHYVTNLAVGSAGDYLVDAMHSE